jgi:hypothetical protein
MYNRQVMMFKTSLLMMARPWSIQTSAALPQRIQVRSGRVGPMMIADDLGDGPASRSSAGRKGPPGRWESRERVN